MHILFIDANDDDDSTNINNVHLSNVESNIVVGDNANEDEEYKEYGISFETSDL